MPFFVWGDLSKYVCRSIYPDEFDNFVERLRSEVINRKFRYRSVDVVGKMLEVVLDTEDVDSTTPRSG